MLPPRIMGRVGRIEQPPELVGKWAFEIRVSLLGSGDGDSLGEWGPFDTEEIAQTELVKACKLACEAAEEAAGLPPSGKYIDMKTNQLKPWDKSDEN